MHWWYFWKRLKHELKFILFLIRIFHTEIIIKCTNLPSKNNIIRHTLVRKLQFRSFSLAKALACLLQAAPSQEELTGLISDRQHSTARQGTCSSLMMQYYELCTLYWTRQSPLTLSTSLMQKQRCTSSSGSYSVMCNKSRINVSSDNIQIFWRF